MARPAGKDRGIVFKEEKWWVRLYVNGREKWYRVDNKSQGKALYGRLKAEVREGKYFPEKSHLQNITLGNWIDRCLEGSTNRDLQHERQRAMYWSTLWGHKVLSEISAEELRKHQAAMVNNAARPDGEKWSSATINRYYSSLRRVLTLAVQEGKLSRHPMRGITFLTEAQNDRFFSDDELKVIRGLMMPEHWKLVHFAVETCLRRSEQFCLRWQDVNFEAKSVTIPLPKGKRTRRVPLSEEALNILRSLPSLLDSPWVFPSPLDSLKHRDPHAVSESFKRVLTRSGITTASWHTLRHTGASRRLLAGVDIVTVSKILGHSTITTTMRYLHLVQSHLQEAINQGSVVEEVLPA
jgi:integrase